MHSEWSETDLGALFEYRSGLSKPRSAFGTGFPFLTFTEVFYNVFIPRNLPKLVESSDSERLACSVRRGDIFLTRTSETIDELGMSCVALRDYPEATFNGFCKRLRPLPDVDILPEYAGYYFRSPGFRRSVTAMSSLSTRASLNNDMLDRLTIILPPLSEQVGIASVLKSLDEKIELNREMNRTLEAMAQAIFRSWFVDFDPVVAKADGREPFGMDAETAALFPNRFVDSELGPVPKGWEVTSFGDLGEFQNRRRVPVSKNNRLKMQGPYPYYGAAGVVDYVNDFLFDEILLLVGEDGSVVDGAGHPILQYVFEKCWVNNHAHVVTGGRASVEFLLLALRDVQIGPWVTGAVQPKLNMTNLKSVPMVFPGNELAGHLQKIAAPLYELVRSNYRESQTLAELRDLLLPKLLSGEIRVPEAEEIVEDIA